MNDDKRYFVIEMAKEWKPRNCMICGEDETITGDCGVLKDDCPLAAARPAVKVKDCQGLEMFTVKEEKR